MSANFEMSILDNCSVAILVAKDETIVYTNKLANEILGFDTKTSRHLPLKNIFINEVIFSQFIQSLNTITTQKPQKVITQLITNNGKPLGAIINVSKSEDPEQKTILSIIDYVPSESKNKLKSKPELSDNQYTIERLFVTISELEFISEFSSVLHTVNSADKIFSYIAQQIHSLNPDSYIVVSGEDSQARGIKIKEVLGMTKFTDQILNLLGQDPRNMVFYPEKMSDEEIKLFTAGSLINLEEGIYALLTRRIPRFICNQLEKLLDITAVYTMSFSLHNQPNGGIIIMMKGKRELMYKTAIESITKQAAIVLEKLEAQNQRKETNSKLKAVFDSMPDGLMVIALDGAILEANKSLNQMFGFVEEENLKGKNIFNYLTEESKVKALKNMGLALKGNNLHNQEYESIKKDGTILPIQINSSVLINNDDKPTAFVSTIKDLTEKRHASEVIKETEQRYKALFYENYTVIVIIDPENGKIVDANNAASEYYGYYPDIIKTLNINQINLIPNDDFFQKILNNCIENKCCVEIKQQLSNEDIRDVEVYGGKIFIEEKELYYAIVHDITERKKFESEIKHAKLKAEENDRLKSAFLQNLSHEIRTPINGIIGFSEMLMIPNLREEKQKQYIEIIINSSQQFLSILDNIVRISTIETGQEKQHISKSYVSKIIEELYWLFKSKASAKNLRLTVKTELADDEDEIYTDKTKIKQIITNLLDNAVKFTREGTIELKCRLESQDTQGNRFILFEIKDTGIGIKPDYKHKIFERFVQADGSSTREFGGMGLGLSISKAYANLMGGSIEVDSIFGAGSIFCVKLPYQPVKNIPDKKANKLFGINNLQINLLGKSILVAEDEMINYLYIEELLKPTNATIYHARNGQETMKMLEELRRVDLVLMDIKMPVMDGYTATASIKAQFPGIPVIAQTAYAQIEDREKAMEAGCDDYVSKPIKQEELFEKIKNLLPKSTNLNLRSSMIKE